MIWPSERMSNLLFLFLLDIPFVVVVAVVVVPVVVVAVFVVVVVNNVVVDVAVIVVLQNQFGTAMATTSLLSVFICWLRVDQLQLFDEHSSLWIAVCLLFGLSKPPNTNRSPWISSIAWRSALFGMGGPNMREWKNR